MNQTWQNSKKSNFRPILARLAQIWAQKFFFVGLSLLSMLVIVASCHCIQFQGKLMILIQTQENDEKSHFGPGPKFGSQKNFFFKNLASSVTRYNGQISSCTISDKTNDPILRKLRDGRTERRADRRTDGKSDFMDAVPPKFSVQQEHLFCLSSYWSFKLSITPQNAKAFAYCFFCIHCWCKKNKSIVL